MYHISNLKDLLYTTDRIANIKKDKWVDAVSKWA